MDSIPIYGMMYLFFLFPRSYRGKAFAVLSSAAQHGMPEGFVGKWEMEVLMRSGVKLHMQHEAEK